MISFVAQRGRIRLLLNVSPDNMTGLPDDLIESVSIRQAAAPADN